MKNNISVEMNGDENMIQMAKDGAQKLDVNFILAHGKPVSSQEALKDITRIPWSKDVLDGKYQGQSIIKSKEKEDK